MCPDSSTEKTFPTRMSHYIINELDVNDNQERTEYNKWELKRQDPNMGDNYTNVYEIEKKIS